MPLTRDQNNFVVNAAALVRLGLPAYSEDDDIIDKIHTEFDSPVRASAAVIPDSKLYFRAARISAADGAGKIVPPISGSIPNFVDSSIDFQGAHATTGATFQGAFPSATSGEFRRVGFTLLSSGQISMIFSPPFASLGLLLAADPGSVFDSAGMGITYADLESIGGTEYKTAGSATDVIENSVSGVPRIFRIAAGGGAGGGSVNLPLKLFAATPASSRVLINGVTVQQTDGTTVSLVGRKATQPTFAGGYFDFSDLSSSAGVSSANNEPVGPYNVGDYYRVAFRYEYGTDAVSIDWSNPAASLAALSDPYSLFGTKTSYKMGWVDLQAATATSFKTADSSLEVIENQVIGVGSRIHNIIYDDSPKTMSGTATVSSSASTVTVSFPSFLFTTNYSVSAHIANSIDANPQIIQCTGTTFTANQMIFKLSAETDSSNYILHWIIHTND